jgi:hypothetical protein
MGDPYFFHPYNAQITGQEKFCDDRSDFFVVHVILLLGVLLPIR